MSNAAKVFCFGGNFFGVCSTPIFQALLGHASPATTARYAHLTDVTEKDSLITINELINTLHVNLRKV